MSILEELSKKDVWEGYLRYKTDGQHLTKKEEADLKAFIDAEEYLPAADLMRRIGERTDGAAGELLPPPRKAKIRKSGSGKKRTIYLFPRAENYVLKLLTYLLLRRYDGLFADSLYSFRAGHGAKEAMRRILSMRGLSRKYSYKLDISNYFNSVSPERMLAVLRDKLADDPALIRFFETMLTNPLVEENGVIAPDSDPKGLMAGTPTAAFMANLYLSDLDREAEAKGLFYCRYSDDIIVFTDTEAEREEAAEFLVSALIGAGLTVNRDKEVRTDPGEQWTFLGIAYQNGEVDISPISFIKIKAKLRRKANALARWKDRKNLPPEKAMKAFIKAFRLKFFGGGANEHDLTWSRWYFPIINTDKTLHEIDRYMQDCIRFLSTEKHNKANYRFRYEQMKALGYEPLVHAWYKEREAAKTQGEEPAD